jgi:hypothetical protein
LTASLAGLLLASLPAARHAAAEVVLLDKGGWQVFTEGRVGAFASEAFGQGIPAPADPGRPLVVGIFGSPNAQEDTANDVLAFRLRSGMMPNILAFGFRKRINEDTTLNGYISLWASADTNRVKYTKSAFDVRQGFLTVDGRWGTLLAGRALSLFARGNYEIDYLYQHGYGFGHPCRLDSTGEEAGFNGGGTCGQIGFGVLHPGYDAGVSYATPSLGGLRLTVGFYDPIGNQQTLPRTPYPRPEAELSFERKFGIGMIKLFASGFWQRSQKLIAPDPTNPMVEALINRDAYGFAGGGRLEIGPLRVGASGFRGKGIGTHFALNGTNDLTTFNSTTFNYRTTEGFYGAIAGVFGRFMVNAGFGMTRVHLLSPDDDPSISTQTLPRQQYGISAGINVRISEQLIYDLDFFRAHSEWYDNGSQDINFISSGLVLIW